MTIVKHFQDEDDLYPQLNNLKERTQDHDVDCLCPDCNTFDDLDDLIQKPIAWMMLNSYGEEITISDSNLREKQSEHTRKLWDNAVPLYNIAPKKEWIGLDPKDIYDAYQEVKGQYRWVERFASAIEAKLKEKNT